MASDKKDGEIEDGEIETDEEEYNVNVIANTANEKSLPASKSSNPTIDNRASSNTNNNKTNKEPVEDDWAINVEKAIANALKKDGVEPPLPNIAIRTQDTEQNQQIPKSKRRKKTKSEKKRNVSQSCDLNKVLQTLNVEYLKDRKSTDSALAMGLRPTLSLVKLVFSIFHHLF